MIHSQCFLCLLSLFRYIKGTVKLGKSLKLRTNEFVYLTCQMLLNHYVKEKQGLGSVGQLYTA